MEHYKTFIIYLLIICFYWGFSGCIDDPVTTNNEVITGKIYDGSFFVYGRLISTGDYPIVSVDRNGEFNLEIVKKPYDLLITDDEYYGLGSTVKYANISNSRNHLILNPLNVGNLFPNPCSFDVEFPALENNDKVFIKFMSEEPFDETHNNDYWGTVFLPHDKLSISGKLIFLQAKVDETGNVLSCEKFGFKDVTLSKGFNGTITFKDEEINFDPEEITSSVNISFPPGFVCHTAEVSLIIPGYSKYSDLVINKLHSFSETIITPLLNSFGFKTKILAGYFTNNYYESEGEDWKLFENGSSINLIHNESITLLSPLPDEENITDTTTFEISDKSNLPAIYEFSIFYRNKSVRIYTNKKSIKLSDFKSWAFSISPGTYYSWSVRKYPNFNSVDEFLSTPYILNKNYSHVESVLDRRFKTRP